MSFEQMTTMPIEVGDLLSRVEQMKKGGNRLVQIGCAKIGDLFEILIDNTNARVKWQLAVKSSWAIAAIVGVVNLAALYFLTGV